MVVFLGVDYIAFCHVDAFIFYLFIWLHQVLVAAYGIWFPDQGLNLGPLHWEPGVLATGPPGKSRQHQVFSTQTSLWSNSHIHI